LGASGTQGMTRAAGCWELSHAPNINNAASAATNRAIPN
jgi:hypothetical protein